MYRARILHNPCLTFAEKRELVLSRLVPKYLHGAGLWRLQTSHERSSAVAPLMGIFRGCIRPFYKRSSERMTNAEVLSALKVASPEEFLHSARIRALGEITDEGMEPAWPGLEADGVWLAAARTSLFEVASVHKPLDALIRKLPTTADLATLADALRGKRPLLRVASRFYLRKRGLRRPEVCWEEVDKRVGSGVAVAIVKTKDPRLAHSCDLCNRSFLSKRRLSVHRATTHRLYSAGRRVCFGTRCEVCCTEFWTGARLAEHLRKQPKCRATYAGSDMAPDAISDKGKAWKPAVVAQGPRPWWATLLPPQESAG